MTTRDGRLRIKVDRHQCAAVRAADAAETVHAHARFVASVAAVHGEAVSAEAATDPSARDEPSEHDAMGIHRAILRWGGAKCATDTITLHAAMVESSDNIK
jgi:hypothetical protein